MSKKYYEDKNRNAYEVKTPLEKLMWKEIEEMWEELLPKIEERDKYKDRIDKATEIIKKYGYEKQMEEDYLMNRVNLANYNCLLLDILKGDNK